MLKALFDGELPRQVYTREGMTDAERSHFRVACLLWPHNQTPETQAFDGRCCWEWSS